MITLYSRKYFRTAQTKMAPSSSSSDPVFADAIERDFKVLETQMSRGSKKITQALLSAAAAFLLAFLLVIGGPSSPVNIPGVNIEVPPPMAAVLFLIASAYFGSAASFYFWRSVKSIFWRNQQIDLVLNSDSMKDEDKVGYYRIVYNHIAELLATSSPLYTNFFILTISLLFSYTLHFMTFWFLLSNIQSFPPSDISNILGAFWGTIFMISGFAFLTAGLPFGLCLFIGWVFRDNIQIFQSKMS